MVWVSAVILLAILQYMVLGSLVGLARGWYKVSAPAVTGHPKFERWFRVHQNSLEMLIAFVPSAWLYGWYVSQTWATAIGIVFIASRIIYSVQYVQEPKTRQLGAALSFLAIFVLIGGGLYGMLRVALTS